MAATEPFDLILFGGTGDLALRKLFPALYYRHRDGSLHSDGRIIGASRTELSDDAFRAQVIESCRTRIPDADRDDDSLSSFAQRLSYQQVDAMNADDYAALGERLNQRPDVVRVFFLATGPSLFGSICEQLSGHELVTPNTRVVLEKPLGHDLASCHEINAAVGKGFNEHQIYRIDHYLGKEAVQNLMALRFGNSLFEPLWRQGFVRNVHITVAESLGVGTRGAYYDRSGALRDMVQNHLLQLLAITAMEPPSGLHPDQVRDEKLKIIRSLRPIGAHNIARATVRGQYREGAVDGEAVVGYLDEQGIPADSHNETYVALRCKVENWRWAGVPFYLRTGKRMREKRAEIVVNFWDVPHDLFKDTGMATPPNRLVIRLQPDEAIKMHIMAKQPGDELKLKPVALNLDFGETFQARRWDAYERLLMEVLTGNLTLFLRRDESEEAWRWIEPIRAAWDASGTAPEPYMAGSWGPTAAIRMIERDNARWPEES